VEDWAEVVDSVHVIFAILFEIQIRPQLPECPLQFQFPAERDESNPEQSNPEQSNQNKEPGLPLISICG
jgi:hypothetical protein